jgi:hypothetical protein
VDEKCKDTPGGGNGVGSMKPNRDAPLAESAARNGFVAASIRV